jgi:hypothetical protein
MFKKILLISVVLLLGSPPVLLGQINHQATFSKDYSITNVLLDDGNTYSRITIPDVQSTDSIGYPKLPVKYLNLIIPAGNNATGIIKKKAETKKLKLERLIEPFQPPIPTAINYQTPDFVKPNKKIYQSDSPFPANITEIVHQGNFRGNRIVTVAVYPFQYIPVNNELIFYSSVDFTLEYASSEATRTGELKKIKKFTGYEKILKNIVDNKSDIEKYDILSSGKTQKNDVAIESEKATIISSGEGISVSCDFVIVTSSALAPEFNEFMAWKRRKGIDIELVTIENILSSYTGDDISGINDDAGKLRQFLSDAYDNGLTYVLLAGDHTIVPIRYGWSGDNTNDEDYIIPTDLYLSDFDGDWEVDSDGRYGEPTNDDVDYNPEIYVGRLLCSATAEVRNWVKKTIMYELNPGNGNYAYLKRAFYTQSDQMQRDNQARYIANKFNSIFNDSLIWEEIYNGQPDYASEDVPEFPLGSQVINEMNNRYGLVSWFGHGGPSSIGMATKGVNEYCYRCKHAMFGMDTWDEDPSHIYAVIPENNNGLDGLNNKDYPSIAYTIACDVTPFDDFNHDISLKNVGESFTVLTESGGPHFLGNTRYGWVGTSYLLFEDFVDVITSNTSFNIGIAEATSKQNFFDYYLRYSHNLVGCPETELWTAIPSQFTNVTIYRYIYDDLYVSTGGVTDCKICVMSALDNGESYYKVVDGVSSYYFPNPPEPYLVTINKHNYIPYIKNPDEIYIQNESIYTQKYIYGINFFAGSNVTDTKPVGPVVIKNGANVVFDADNEVTIEDDFEVEAGADFEIK